MRSIVERSVTIAGLCALIAFVGFAGLQAYGYGVDTFRAYIGSGNWQRTTGVITSSTARPGCGRAGIGHYLDVRYTFRADGREHLGNRVWFGNGYCAGRAGAESMASKYVVGAKIDVYFNPDSVSESVLVRGTVENGTLFLFALLLCPPLGAAALLLRSLHQARSRRPIDIEARRWRAESLDRSIRLELEERTTANNHVAPPRDA